MCYGETKDNYYPLSKFSGVKVSHYDATLHQTMVLEFCYSVAVVDGEYNTTTRALTSGAEPEITHNYGYYLNTIGDATGDYELIAQYQQGDQGWPCATVEGGFFRNSTVAIRCMQYSGTCLDGTTCTLESWGGCVCRFFADSTCHYEIDLLLNCDDREGYDTHLAIYLLKCMGFFTVVMVSIILFNYAKKNKQGIL